jgi:hypothetical protein
MTTPTRTHFVLALLIAALLAGAYMIVERNNAAMGQADGAVPSGMLH